MAEISKAYLMYEIPHACFQWIVKFLLDANALSSFELFSLGNFQIVSKKRISNANEFELVSNSFFEVKFNPHRQSSCREPNWICSKNNALEFINAWIKITEMLGLC